MPDLPPSLAGGHVRSDWSTKEGAEQVRRKAHRGLYVTRYTRSSLQDLPSEAPHHRAVIVPETRTNRSVRLSYGRGPAALAERNFVSGLPRLFRPTMTMDALSAAPSGVVTELDEHVVARPHRCEYARPQRFSLERPTAASAAGVVDNVDTRGIEVVADNLTPAHLPGGADLHGGIADEEKGRQPRIGHRQRRKLRRERRGAGRLRNLLSDSQQSDEHQ